MQIQEWLYQITSYNKSLTELWTSEQYGGGVNLRQTIKDGSSCFVEYSYLCIYLG